MSNPIKASDLYKDDGALERAIDELVMLGEAHKAVLAQTKKEAIKLEVEVKKLTGSTSQHKQSIKDAAVKTDELKKAYDKYNQALEGNQVELAAVKQAQANLNKMHQLEAKLLTTKEGSYDRLSAQYGILKLRLNQMSDAERTATEEGIEMEKQSNAIYQQMKKLQEATGQHQLSVGDYAKANRGLVDVLEEVPGAAGDAGRGVMGLGKQFKALLKNPVVLVVSLLVGALYTLFNAFKSSEKGAQLMARASAVLSGAWSILVGFVSDFAGGVMKAFKDPVQAMKDFWAALKENVVNRFEGVIKLAQSLAGVLKGLWDRDLEAIRENAKAAGQSLLQMGTGLDSQDLKDFGDALKEQTQTVKDQLKAFDDLAKMKYRVAQANREIAKSIEQLTTQEELLLTVRDDNAKSFKEREEAGIKALELSKKRASEEVRLAKNNLSLLNTEIDLRSRNNEDVQGLLDQQLSAYREVAAAERGLLLASRESEKEMAMIKQDRLEKDLDILIDGVDNQKTVNERIIADETRTFEERAALLEETRRLVQDSYLKQAETIQQFTGITVDANDLVNTSDAVALNKKIRDLGLSEIIEGRLLEVVRERRTFTQDLNEAEIALNESRVKAAQAQLELERKALDERRTAELENFDQLQALEASKLDLTKATEAEKTKAQLSAERERLSMLLDMNKKYLEEYAKMNLQYQDALSSTQIETIQNQLIKIQREIEAIDKGGIENVYDLFGLNMTDEQEQVISDAFSFAKGQLNEYFERRVEVANQLVERSDDQVEGARRELEAQVSAAQAGYASRVTIATKELDLAKRNQKAALREQQKAQQAQQAIQAVEQTGNLITASTKIWSTLGFPFALLALGVLWGSFAAAQAKAFSLTRRQFGGGGFERFDYGNSHSSGNDISLGVTKTGVERRVERNESMAIFTSKATREYGLKLPEIVNAINRGTFEARYGSMDVLAMPSIFTAETDTSRIEGELREMNERGKLQHFIDGNGRVVELYKNRRRVYVE